jgi:hypothetical protein
VHPYPVDVAYAINLATYPALERRVFTDRNVSLIFASDTDQRFHALHFPGAPSEVWTIKTSVNPDVRVPTQPRLIHFGGVSVHKAAGLRYFIRRIYPDIRRFHPRIELHLHGVGTRQLDDRQNGVYGHGRLESLGIPHGGDGLFVNPDLLGGGIKIKVGDWLEWGVPFISTPFGVDGYSIAQSPHRIIAPIEDWPGAISSYFGQLGL